MISKSLFCYIILLVLTIACDKKATMSIEDTLTKDEKWWGHDRGSSTWDWCLFFKKSGKFEYIYAGEGSYHIEGNYNIENDKIQIQLTGKSENTGFKLPRKQTCSLDAENDSLKYVKKITCENKVYYGYAYPAINIPRKYKGIDIITLGGIDAETREPVIYREKPNISGKPIKCKLVANSQEDGTMIATSTLPVNKHISLIARTSMKTKIKNWENYWYLVDVSYDPHDGESCENDLGWVFGEFIKIKNSNQ